MTYLNGIRGVRELVQGFGHMQVMHSTKVQSQVKHDLQTF